MKNGKIWKKNPMKYNGDDKRQTVTKKTLTANSVQKFSFPSFHFGFNALSECFSIKHVSSGGDR